MSKHNAIFALNPDERPPLYQSSFGTRDSDAETPAAGLRSDPCATVPATVGVSASEGALGPQPATPSITEQRDAIAVNVKLMLHEALEVHAALESIPPCGGTIILRKPVADLRLQVGMLMAAVIELQRAVGRAGQ